MRHKKRSSAVIFMLVFSLLFGGIDFGGILKVYAEAIESDLISVIDVSIGEGHTLALTSNGRVFAWGSNASGRLGDSTQVSRGYPAEVLGLDNIISVAAGPSYSMALREDGTVWTWGNNRHGQLGDGTTETRLLPIQVPNLTDVKEIAVGSRETDAYSMALQHDGTLWGWGKSLGYLGNYNSVTKPSKLGQDFVSISVGETHALALKSDGTVWAWGDNNFGQLGTSSTLTSSKVPRKIENLTGVVAVSAGVRFSTVIKNDGTVWTWGRNAGGELGSGDKVSRPTPGRVAGLNNIVGVSSNNGYTLALAENGTVWAWGSSLPVLLDTLQDVTKVYAGTGTYAAITNDGILQMWGKNNNGQLGDGTLITHSQPQEPILSKVLKLELSGDGTISNPYILKEWGDLNHILKDSSAHYVLGNDLETNDETLLALNFNGTLDGAGYNININQEVLGYTNSGIVSIIDSNRGTIQNIGIQGIEGIASLVRKNEEGGRISRVFLGTTAKVGESYGIVHTNDGTVTDSLVLFEVTDNLPESVFAYTGKGTINRCAYTGGKAKTLVGDANSTLKVFDSYVQGGKLESVTGTSTNPTLIFQYNYIAISPQSEANAVQEVLGTTQSVLRNTYYNISGVSEGRKSLAQLKDINTYEFWDFDEVWDIDPNKNGGFPFLRNQPELDDFAPKPQGLQIDVTNNPTAWTNQDITLQADLKNSKGSEIITLPDNSTVTGTSATYIVAQNGTYTFKGNDTEGKEVVNEVEVTKIDKDKPTTPVLSVTPENEVNIQLGTDALSGIKEHRYKLNEGNWLTNFDLTSLADGTYTLQVKAIDNATNESDVATITFTKTGDKIEEEVIEEVNKDLDNVLSELDKLGDNPTQAEKDTIQYELDRIQDIIDNIKDADAKKELQDKLDDLQGKLDAIIENQEKAEVADRNVANIQDKIDNLPEKPTLDDLNDIQKDIDDLQKEIDNLKDGSLKDELQDKLDSLQSQLDQEKDKLDLSDKIQAVEDSLNEANTALTDLEKNLTEEGIDELQKDLDKIKEDINKLPEGADKDRLDGVLSDLQDRLDDIKHNYEVNKGIEIEQGTQNIAIGDKVTLTHTSKLDVEWESSDPAVAAVNATGRVTGMGQGSAVITVRIIGTDKTDSIVVNVAGVVVPVVSFTIAEEEIELELGESHDLNYEVLPTNATNQTIIWTSSDTKVATVVNGKVRALKEGNVVITGKTEDKGYTAGVYVKVLGEKVVETPVSITVTYEDTVWTNLARLQVDVEGDFKEIILPNNAIVYKDGFIYTVRENGTYTFSVVGKDGVSVDSAIVDVSKVDKTKPIIIFSSNPEDITQVLVEVIDHESGLDYLRMPTGTRIFTTPYTFDAMEERGTFLAYDEAGNVGEKDYQSSQVMISGGTTHTFIGIEGIPDNWTNQSANVRIGAQNLVDGIESLEVTIGEPIVSRSFMMFGLGMEDDDQTVTGDVYNEPVIIEDFILDDNSMITFKVKNGYGEYEDIAVVNKIDKGLPSLEVEVSGSSIQYTATDDLSGIRYIELPNGDMVEVATDEQLIVTGTLDFEANGVFSILVEDYAGNRIEELITLNFTPDDEDNNGADSEDKDPEDKDPGDDNNGGNEPEEDNNGGKDPDDSNNGSKDPVDKDKDKGSSGGSGGSGGSNKQDVEKTREYKTVYAELLKNIPYTLLKDSKVDWNTLLDTPVRDLKVKVDTSKVGKTILTVDLMGVKSEFDVEIVALIERQEAVSNIPEKHWASRYAADVIKEGYIQGIISGELKLDATLNFADSFTAYDRLLLKHGLVTMNLDRQGIDKLAKDMKDTWYTLPVKSILSKFLSIESVGEYDLSNLETPIRREEIAQIIYNSMKDVLKQDTIMKQYKDMHKVNNIDAVVFATRAGVIEGDTAGNINPQGYLTRAEFMTILSRLNTILNNQLTQ